MIQTEIQRKALARTLNETKSKGFSYLKFITAVDYPDHVQVIYMFANLQTAETLNLELKLHKTDDDLWIDSIIKEFPSANWYERELSEMFGIKVMGRSAKRLLLENWNGTEYPLRKEFVWGNEYKKVE